MLCSSVILSTTLYFVTKCVVAYVNTHWKASENRGVCWTAMRGGGLTIIKGISLFPQYQNGDGEGMQPHLFCDCCIEI